MASALSEEEFHRMQLQLLELRTVNYQQDDKCKRQERDLVGLLEQLEIKDRDLQKATKTISKSKKAKEVELLNQEYEALQLKLHSQEEEFRLQNETIMLELGQVIKTNERLEKENAGLKGGSSGAPSGDSTGPQQDEVRRLQAQNTALQKNITACREKHETEVHSLRQTITDLEAQCLKLSGQRGTPVGAGNESRTVEGQSDPESSSEPPSQDITSTNPDEDQPDSSHPAVPKPASSTTDRPSLQQTVDKQEHTLNELRLNLDTEQEEKRILKEQLSSLESEHKERAHCLQEDLDKMTEKFKKKQESLVHLQEEKELIYTELRNRLQEVEATKEVEIGKLKNKSDKLTQDLTQCNEVLEDFEQKSNIRIHELESLVNNLETQVSDSDTHTQRQVSERSAFYEDQLHQLQRQAGDHQRKQAGLEGQLKESQGSIQKVVQEKRCLEEDRDHQLQLLQEANKVAEKRKTLLDELAIKYQQESDQHREQVKVTEEGHRAEVDLLTDQLEEAKTKCIELDSVKEELEKIKSQLHSLDNTKGWLERRLNETEDNLNQSRVDHDESLSKLEAEHEAKRQELEEGHQQQIEVLEEEKRGLVKDIEDKEQQIQSIKQEVKDSQGEKKIHEKKGATIIKDLKRQLHQERKRAEKMQERLQDFLSDGRSRQSVEELFRPVDPNDRHKTDASSLSSWNASILSRENTLQSPDEEYSPSVSLETENSDLLKRLGDVQQEKWMLEEKVSHLESSNSCMAEDLLQKTAVIEHYVMDSRIESAAQSPSSDKMSLKRMMDLIKDRGDDNLRDMNKKLQHMLEETLTKNMHLQKDMETLSQEIVRLSKECAPSNTEKTAK